jgi:hypothetical protein
VLAARCVAVDVVEGVADAGAVGAATETPAGSTVAVASIAEEPPRLAGASGPVVPSGTSRGSEDGVSRRLTSGTSSGSAGDGA